MVDIRELVVRRSGGHCEASIKLYHTWTRCGRMPIEDHHLLTRARGGDLLDKAGEINHHLALCHTHHRAAHGAGGRLSDLLIDGYAWLDSATNQIIYEGPDDYLTEKYGRQL